MKKCIITTLFLLGSLITHAQHDCITENKLIKETDGVKKVKNETVIICYSKEAFDLVSKTTGQILFNIANFDSYINPDGYKEEFISSRETQTEAQGWYQVNIIHGPTKEIRIKAGRGGVTYIVQTRNKDFVQYEKPVYKYEEPKDLSSDVKVTYNLDSFVNAKIRWYENERNVDCQVAAKLFVGGDGKISWQGSTVEGQCLPKENFGFLGRVKQALNDSWFVPAKDKDGTVTGQYYETTLHIKGAGGGIAANEPTGQEENGKDDAAKKETVKDAKNAAKDGARKLLKGFGR